MAQDGGHIYSPDRREGTELPVARGCGGQQLVITLAGHERPLLTLSLRTARTSGGGRNRIEVRRNLGHDVFFLPLSLD